MMRRNDALLSEISTRWTLLRCAHAGSPEQAVAARELLWMRYKDAIRRYLASALHDSHAADDLAQEFGLRLVRGDFRGADPSRGRFRDYARSVLFRMVSQHRRRHMKTLARELQHATATVENDEREDRFRREWRSHLLARTWAALEEVNPAQYSVLRFRAAHPELSSTEIAAELSGQLGKSLTAAGVRQLLVRARDSFARLLVDEVAQSLESPSREALQSELAELRLLTYCESLLERRAAFTADACENPSTMRQASR
jgi:RNA polymerase sigma-70 factor (ECF subfamily)